MYQLDKNKNTKRLLMAGLGNEFARAGIHTDGVRTNFSVMSYQVVKQVTGLARIPSKLLLSCLVSPDRSLEWIDISAHPTATLTEYKEAVQEVLGGLGMHQTIVEDSAQPMLLPQVTVTKEVYAFVMRYAIRPPTNKQQDSLQDLTNRFTVFLGGSRIVTVHRTQCNFVEELKQDWQRLFQEERRSQRFLLYYFVKEIAHTFSAAISACIVEFDAYEAGLFSSSRNRSNLAREIYHIKRRASAYGRTLTLTQDAYSHIASSLKIYTSDVLYQEIQHDLAHVQSLADELNANADSVLQLLFQLSSYQVNELMRVLTLFSAFFIPLSFIASAYGMNFDGLPFLHNPNGELYCAFMMMSVATFIFVWFKKKHFM
ncbi:metal ion transporter, MIT family [Strigomonas culicis]|uniref:Metal ion transporter, MIT family n=1 Tax=Strigomonas culicis TaxID=28005 RepID=S9URH5_9TRYP|nr:metal ion transporter, MIT family [Strigomonas culicis]|eukprot:EPY33522.1 metal ion transporter, MIT family [Strigomonas culicis]